MITSKDKEKLFLFTVISEEYAKLGLAWGLQVKEVTGIKPHFVCSDEESFRYLKSHRFPCTKYAFVEANFAPEEKNYGEIHFPTEKAVFTISLKLEVASEYLKSGYTILYSDVDAIWLKNPLADLKSIDADFLFQPGSFPDDAKKLWGFSACTGFFLMRPSPQAAAFADTVRSSFDGDDQRTLNQVLLNNYHIDWSERPEAWEHCAIKDGWTKPVLGRCERTGLTLAALGHSFYQRHGTKKGFCQHAIVCHPNSPKDQDGKFETLQGLGINLGPISVSQSVEPVREPEDDGTHIEVGRFLNWFGRFWKSDQK
ncbi:putative nucleotide-diphospho-sugar transferase [Marivita geojedonensis]|uniref:Nucleotide-diphospho-sugar transferase domain-containing protein n=2 Tax=Marivita geojedonensis TaxID=1123756 RepID=A0A1X4NEB8_9RHOB|nr:putative nucleotide-diphospho-sugar transferase [Marivita geojedonensis]OSQ45271.1 hypothetical protein MGEO_18290 [Marivita geojedonensis]PRY73894.1 nucleotide-diphospho-sugar transferase [Marivita geojedonensis]